MLNLNFEIVSVVRAIRAAELDLRPNGLPPIVAPGELTFEEDADYREFEPTLRHWCESSLTPSLERDDAAVCRKALESLRRLGVSMSDEEIRGVLASVDCLICADDAISEQESTSLPGAVIQVVTTTGLAQKSKRLGHLFDLWACWPLGDLGDASLAEFYRRHLAAAPDVEPWVVLGELSNRLTGFPADQWIGRANVYELTGGAGLPVFSMPGLPFPEAGIPLPFTREPKLGRNDPCPCGSGRKYKRCCLRRETVH